MYYDSEENIALRVGKLHQTGVTVTHNPIWNAAMS